MNRVKGLFGMTEAERLHQQLWQKLSTTEIAAEVVRSLTQTLPKLVGSPPRERTPPREVLQKQQVTPDSVKKIHNVRTPPRPARTRPQLMTIRENIKKRRKSLFPGWLDKQKVHVLYDTGADRSCISKVLYDRLPQQPPLKKVDLAVVAAGGKSLGLVGEAYFTLKLGKEEFSHPFLVLTNLRSDVIVGTDMQHRYALGQSWKGGDMMIVKDNEYLIATVNTRPRPALLKTSTMTTVPPRSVAALITDLSCDPHLLQRSGEYLTVRPVLMPSLLAIPSTHRLSGAHMTQVAHTVFNHTDQPVTLKRGQVLASLDLKQDVAELNRIDAYPEGSEFFLSDEWTEEIQTQPGFKEPHVLPVDPPGTETMTSPAQGRPVVKPPLGEYPLSSEAEKPVSYTHLTLPTTSP